MWSDSDFGDGDQLDQGQLLRSLRQFIRMQGRNGGAKDVVAKELLYKMEKMSVFHIKE